MISGDLFHSYQQTCTSLRGWTAALGHCEKVALQDAQTNRNSIEINRTLFKELTLGTWKSYEIISSFAANIIHIVKVFYAKDLGDFGDAKSREVDPWIIPDLIDICHQCIDCLPVPDLGEPKKTSKTRMPYRHIPPKNMAIIWLSILIIYG